MNPSDVPCTQHRWVSPGYFNAMNISILRGREFTDADNERGANVVVIDRALAQRFFPNENPIGAHLRITLGGDSPQPEYEVVGLVESVKHIALTEDPTPTFYGPIAQTPKDVVPFLATNFSLVVRSGIAPEALAGAMRRELRAIDPDVAGLERQTDARFARRLDRAAKVQSRPPPRSGLDRPPARRRRTLNGVVTYIVTQRTREIGLRLALGARRSDILSI